MATSTHDVGHGKFETIGALGISGVLLATAGGIAWHAFDVLTANKEGRRKDRQWTHESQCLASSCGCHFISSCSRWGCNFTRLKEQEDLHSPYMVLAFLVLLIYGHELRLCSYN